jgi:pimeloyl-ACP methyl ester carboxylesterase
MAFTFPGFEQMRLSVPSEDGPIEIACLVGGNGPALLLLHGFPQTKAIWHQLHQNLLKTLLSLHRISVVMALHPSRMANLITLVIQKDPWQKTNTP